MNARIVWDGRLNLEASIQADWKTYRGSTMIEIELLDPPCVGPVPAGGLSIFLTPEQALRLREEIRRVLKEMIDEP